MANPLLFRSLLRDAPLANASNQQGAAAGGQGAGAPVLGLSLSVAVGVEQSAKQRAAGYSRGFRATLRARMLVDLHLLRVRVPSEPGSVAQW
ncbi:hypothetical protein ICE59_001923 [Salmonella enterica subsp. enterica serovar Agama]|nr:hypothetical protein [Salmonella enterica subsp. enterica serovar Agama]EGJ4668016.1 hypothetical protein [Salmonella enterica]